MNDDFNPPAHSQNDVVSTNSIIQGAVFDRVMQLAAIMASGNATVPKHLQKNQADCAAIVMQAMQWGMNPFAVAQKTHITQGGVLGYEAQLVNAVIMENGPLENHPEYEFIGDWNRILGRVKEVPGSEGKGKKYVSDWAPTDENGLGVICHYKIMGLPVRQVTLMLKQCWPRFSTQWATDPQQQICYAVIKKIARREFPGVILGVYTRDELEGEREEIDITPRQPEQPPAPPEKPAYSPESFKENLPKWRALVESGKKTPEQIVMSISTLSVLTADQINQINNLAVIEGQADEATGE